MKILHTTVQPGESLFGAIVRASIDAARSKMDGYQIDCEICGESVEDHLIGKITRAECRPGLSLIGKRATDILRALRPEEPHGQQ